MVGSLIVAILIVIVTIAVVTARLGPSPEVLEEEREQREEQREERREGTAPGRGSFATSAQQGDAARSLCSRCLFPRIPAHGLTVPYRSITRQEHPPPPFHVL
jgi:hypothetical protein